jgi:UDP-N-acetylmuramoyl-tripeptide--D-alanyl-D-alanine ligase
MSLQKSFEKYLSRCVRMSFGREKPLVIGIAGSVGKTSTRAAVGIVLGAAEQGSGVVMSDKNFNNDLGVPMTVFGCAMPGKSPFKWLSLLGTATLSAIGLKKLRAKTFVLELGTDRPGDLARLMRMVQPKIGVLTAIGAEHTEYFGTVENVAKEEATIVAMLPKDGVAIYNTDDARVKEICEQLTIAKLSFGRYETPDIDLIEFNIHLDPSGADASGLRLKYRVGQTDLDLSLTGTVGRPQALSCAAALAVVSAMGGDLQQAIVRLSRDFHGMHGRMRLIPGIKHTWLIDDTYNSSPLAAYSAIRDLLEFPIEAGAKRIAALGDMLELGDLSEQAHLEMGKAAADSGLDLLVACGTLAHVIAKGAREAGMPEEKVFTFAKSADAGLFIQERLHANDVVLIKGSQGVRMERITKELMARPDLAERLLVRHTPDWLERP